MPISGEITSYDVGSNAASLSQVFNMLKFPGTPLFNMIQEGRPVANTVHTWWEDNVLPTSTTLAAAYTAADGEVTLTSAYGLRKNSIIRIADTIMRLTAAPTLGTGVCTVTVVENDENQANGSDVEFLGNAAVEGADYADADSNDDQSFSNVTQIFSDFAEVTGTQQALVHEVSGLPNQLDRDVTRKMQRLYYQMARAIWRNYYVSPANNSTPRILGGIDYFITNNGYTSSGAFSRANIDAFLYACAQEYYADMEELWMNPATLDNFTDLNDSKIRVAREDSVAGNIVNRYISGRGYDLKLMTDPNCPTDAIYLFSANRLRWRPLNKRSMNVSKLDKTGDSTRVQILGEYTLEFNPCTSAAKYSIA